MFYFIRFLLLFKYRKTENRPHMTEKNVNWNVKYITRQIKYTLHLLSVHHFCILKLETLYTISIGQVKILTIFTYRVHVSIRCCYTFPFTYTYSYAANPDNSINK